MDEGFREKVKRNVTQYFDQSFKIYQAFEEKHGFFSALALKLADRIDLAMGASVLDVGCGNGISANALNKQLGCCVLGVDLSTKMIAAGRSLCDSEDIHLVVGDGEDLSRVVGDRRFDYVLYNASIFIFPHVSKTFDHAMNCLCSGGKIAFSFYPQILGTENEDLLAIAFRRLGAPLPQHRVITSYTKACDALKHRCGNIRHHHWARPLDIDFLRDFFSIPAQSASLFPKLGYEERKDLVGRLFGTIDDKIERGHIVWRMAEGIKTNSSSAKTSGAVPFPK